MCTHYIDTVMVESKLPYNYIIIDVGILIYSWHKKTLLKYSYFV